MTILGWKKGSCGLGPKNNDHYRKLERMYLSAAINKWYKPRIAISDRHCEITMPLDPKFYHAAEAVHGSIYFKMLDDAAFFAANSIILDVFALTTNFNINLLKPVSKGMIKSSADLTFASKSSYIAEARLFDETGDLLAVGMGTFVKSKIALSSLESYQ